MTFLDFCAGIGGFRLGMELAGHRCIGFCEKDKYAVKSYRAMFDTKGEWYADDVKKLKPEDVPNADGWCFGFPCQDVSVAGHQQGLSGERSSIYFTILNLIKGKKEEDKPTFLLIENVKNLLSVNDGWDFAEVLNSLEQAGYDAEWQVLNSKDFGVPQNRERVFIVAHLRSRGGRQILPVGGENSTALKKLVGGSQGYRVYDAEGISCTLQSQSGGAGAKTGLYAIGNVNPSGRGMNGTVYDANGISPTVTTNKGEGNKILIDVNTAENSGVLEAYPVLTPDRALKRQNGRRMKEAEEPMFTLTGQDRHGVAIIDDRGKFKSPIRMNSEECPTLLATDYKQPKKVIVKETTKTGYVTDGEKDSSCNHRKVFKSDYFRIRRLTPRECFRLQGFPDELFEKAQAVNSDSQLYKQAGNAVTVNVIFAIAMKLSL